MNLNILTIDVLPAMQAQAVRSNQSRGAGNSDDSGRISDITTNNTGESLKDAFEIVFKRKLKANDSQFNSGNEKTALKLQKSDKNEKNKQIPTEIASLIDTSTLFIQKQVTIDGKSVLKQPISQTAAQTIKSSKSPALVTPNNIKDSTFQETQPTVSTTRNQNRPANAGQKAVMPQASVRQAQPADTERTSKKVAMTQSQDAETAGSGKTALSANQFKSSEKTESFTAQAPVVIHAVKTADSKAGLNAVNNIISRAKEQIPTGSAGRGDTKNVSRTIDKSSAGRQARPKQASGSENKPNESAENLNLEKVEFVSARNNTAKPDSVNEAIMPREQTTPANAGQNVMAVSQSVAKNASMAVNTSLPDNAAGVRDQIYQSVKSSIQQGQNQIIIRLNPPELGQVSVKFIERNNELTGLLEATNAQTRAEISQALPEIVRSLEESGVSIKRLDVTLSDVPRQPFQQSQRDNNPHDLWQQLGQNDSRQPGNQFAGDSYAQQPFQVNSREPFSLSGASINPLSPSYKMLDILL